jgi:diguanylate cyclase (GGDEF)-like protein
VFAAAFALAWASIALAPSDARAAIIWPVNGVMLAPMLRSLPTRWPWLAAAIMLGTSIAYWATGAAFMLALLLGLFSSAELLLASHILYRSFHGMPDLTQQGALIRFGLSAVILAPLAAVLPGALLLCELTNVPFLELARIWYLSDALGLAVFGPLALSVRPGALLLLFGRENFTRTLMLFLLLAACTSLALYQSRYPLLYVIYPPLLLVVFRLSMPGVVIGVVIITILTIAFTAAGRGTFMLIEHGDWTQRVLLIQVFIATTLATMLPVAAVLAQRNRLTLALRASEERLTVLSGSDPLTGLANRRSFDAALEHNLARAGRSGRPLSLLMIDVDHFKDFNDRFGHLCGDACLQRVAAAVAHHAHRPDDLAARFGGEEFAMILPDTDAQGAAAIAEGVRSFVKSNRGSSAAPTCESVSVSIGVASVSGLGKISATQLIQAADNALYTAKHAGRDRVCVAGRDSSSTG